MKHADLLAILKNLERKWESKVKTPTYSGGAIRPPAPLGNIQFFALTPTKGDDDNLPVVVEIGINYTQRNKKIPSLCVVDESLKIAREQGCIASFNAHPKTWIDCCVASSNLPCPFLLDPTGKVKQFHLVCTNFSPWITMGGWGAWSAELADLFFESSFWAWK